MMDGKSWRVEPESSKWHLSQPARTESMLWALQMRQADIASPFRLLIRLSRSDSLINIRPDLSARYQWAW